ncbi:MAG: hypothetical protein EA341_08830 [Mongoliibacter sp.]|nr:MAG: hypothetical protein EA341_08830 [Mongoliibacter sp.]
MKTKKRYLTLISLAFLKMAMVDLFPDLLELSNPIVLLARNTFNNDPCRFPFQRSGNELYPSGFFFLLFLPILKLNVFKWAS